MTKVEEAAKHLERAVARLEAACLKLERSGGGEDSQLALALSEARAEYEKLADVAGAVATRLDGAIERLNTVLEN
jgi:exonuclease VII small subunit